VVKKYQKKPHSFSLTKINRYYDGLTLLTTEQKQEAKQRIRKYDKRDEDKIKNDKAKNDFESLIYSMRDWLTDDQNTPYATDEHREELLGKLLTQEDWLLDGEGEFAEHQEYNKRRNELNSQLQKLQERKSEHEKRNEGVERQKKKLGELQSKIEALDEKKPWIKEE